MANQIGPRDHEASDWFRANNAARGTAIIFIYHEPQPFKGNLSAQRF